MSVKLKYFESGSNLAQVFGFFFTLRAVESIARILMFDNTDSIVLQFKLQLMPEMFVGRVGTLMSGISLVCVSFKKLTVLGDGFGRID